jgi:PhnB protein
MYPPRGAFSDPNDSPWIPGTARAGSGKSGHGTDAPPQTLISGEDAAMELEPYLSFNGNCEEALAFYSDVFGGEVTALNRYAGSPMAETLPPEAGNKIMHSNFKSPTLKFMASDNVHQYEPAGNVSLSLGTKDQNEAKRVFGKLSEGGNVGMPLQDMFWGALFGMVTDKYGISWLMNCEKS